MPDPVVTIRQLAACNNLTTSESNQIATSCTAAYRVSFGAAADENAAVTALRSYLEANNLQAFLGMQLESHRHRPLDADGIPRGGPLRI